MEGPKKQKQYQKHSVLVGPATEVAIFVFVQSTEQFPAVPALPPGAHGALGLLYLPGGRAIENAVDERSPTVT